MSQQGENVSDDKSELALSRVRDWDTSGAVTHSSSSVASLLCAETVKAFRNVARYAERRGNDVSDRRRLKQNFDTFMLWAMGYGVREGDLDEALAASWTLQRSILELLVFVGTLLWKSM